MQLSDKQKQIIEGLICPYCGRETELANADEVYHTKGLGMVRLCRHCFAWVGVHKKGDLKGKALGRLSNGTLRALKMRIHAEFDRTWDSPKKRKEVYRSLSEFLGIPEEYTHIGMFGEKTLDKVLDFCIEKGGIEDLKLERFKKGSMCEKRNNCIEVGSSACHGCPEFVIENKEGIVYCDPDMSYGQFKKKHNG